MAGPKPVLPFERGYSVPRAAAPVDLHLDANEGRAPSLDLMAHLKDPEVLRRYPSRAGLRDALAAYIGVSPDEVLVTNGGDDALDRCARAFLTAGRNLVLPTPSFEMIERYASLRGAEIRRVAWGDRDALPVDDYLAAIDDATGMVAIVTPNNPTGAAASVDAIVTIAEAAPHALVVVDLAYVEFADDDPTEALLGYENVVMVRTLSKAWGLAGLRVGYAVGQAPLLAALNAAGGPYPASSASLQIARAVVEREQVRVAAFVEEVRAERERLSAAMEELGARPSPSQANFVFARVHGGGAWWRDAFASLGIGIRAWPDKPGLHDAIRVTCPGDSEEFERVMRALRCVAKPDALLLDMDGIIANVSGSYRRAVIETAASFGVDVTHEDIVAEKEKGDANNDWRVTRRLLAARGVEASLEEVTERFEDRYQGRNGFDGLWKTETLLVAREWLASLKAYFDVAVVTGRPRKDADRFIEHHGLSGLFPVMICMEDGPAKPSPEPLQMAMSKLGVTSAWMVGDTPDDMTAARRAGAVGVGVLAPGETRRDALYAAGAAWVLDETSQLKDVLPMRRGE